MKNLYFFLMLLLCIKSIGQNRLDRLDKSDMETSILFSAFPLIDVSSYQTSINSVYTFYQTYKSLVERDSQNRFLDLETFKLKADDDFRNNKMSIAILSTDFEIIKEDALANGNIYIDSEGYIMKSENAASIFERKELTIATPLRTKHKGLNVTFNLFEENILNTTSKQISQINIDFDNGEGFKTVILNSDFDVRYITDGFKNLTTEIRYSDGSSKTSFSKVKVSYSKDEMRTIFNRVITTFESENTPAPNLSAYGINNDIGTGEYEIFLSDNNILDKPIILIDGFDPGDTRDITGIYSLLNFDDNGTGSNLADVVRAQGFDVILLNFPVYTRTSDNEIIDGGADFIERNAMLLVELIDIINTTKIPTADQNVIIGPSMGGIISRFALNFIESSGGDADTRLWISFDSPHLGANVPIGFQYLFNKMAYGLQLGGLGGDQSIEALRPLVDDFLRSPAAKQMLTDHFDAHITSGTDFDLNLRLPIAHPWHNLLYNELIMSGFPQNVRKVSIINGSGIGNLYQDKLGMDIDPNFLALNIDNLQIGSGITSSDGDFRARFTPFKNQINQTGFVSINAPFLCFCDFEASSNVEATDYSDGIDAAPGGLFDIGGITGDLGSDPLITDFLAGLTTDYFNFIPTVSAMALNNDGEIDWYHIPENLTNSRTVENETPFINWYMPDDNEDHVFLTSANVNFALSEILNSSLGIDNVDEIKFQLENNPVKNNIVLITNSNNREVIVDVFDITGKRVMTSTKPLQNRSMIPVNLNSGFYILNLTDELGNTFTTKFVVNK